MPGKVAEMMPLEAYMLRSSCCHGGAVRARDCLDLRLK